MADPVSEADDWTTAIAQASYDGFKSRVFYFWEEGRVQMPVAYNNGTPSEVCKVSAAWGRKVVAYVGRRTGQQVDIPPREPDVVGKQAFLRERFVLDTVDPDAAGVVAQASYTVSGWREYALLLPLSPDNGDTLTGYWPPTLVGSPTQNTLGPGNLDVTQNNGGQGQGFPALYGAPPILGRVP